jgi:ferritin
MEKKLVDAINEQIKNELYSSYLYLAMAAWAEAQNLAGFAHWLKVQSKEETGHGMKLYEFLIDRGAKVVLQAIAQPPLDFASAQDIFEKTLEHEKKVTAMINGLHDLALSVKDKPAEIALQWFITEQVEEEKNATTILEKLKMIKDSKGGLLYLDKELKKRAG